MFPSFFHNFSPSYPPIALSFFHKVTITRPQVALQLFNKYFIFLSYFPIKVSWSRRGTPLFRTSGVGPYTALVSESLSFAQTPIVVFSSFCAYHHKNVNTLCLPHLYLFFRMSFFRMSIFQNVFPLNSVTLYILLFITYINVIPSSNRRYFPSDQLYSTPRIWILWSFWVSSLSIAQLLPSLQKLT